MLKTKKQPQLSLNLLARYASAKPAGRYRILQDAKYPDDFMTIYYAETARAIARSIEDGEISIEHLTGSVAALHPLPGVKPAQRQRANNNVNAALAFLKLLESLDLEGMQITPITGRHKLFTLNDVAVSVRPEFVLRRDYRGQSQVGVVKLYFSKDHPLQNDAAELVGQLLVEHATASLCQEGETRAIPELSAYRRL
jgi:hypothetical protein